jgi:predicted nucleic acid-binding protein
VKLLLDTSVWVEHLRHAALSGLIEDMRGRFVLCMDAVVASALAAREGALLVTHNLSDFTTLASEIPVRVESFGLFQQQLLGHLR